MTHESQAPEGGELPPLPLVILSAECPAWNERQMHDYARAAIRAAQRQAEAWRHLRDEAKEAVERAREINALGAEITAPAEGDSRSAFESWVTRDRGLPAYVLDRYTDGRYCDLGIDRDWAAWSAALASKVQPKGTEPSTWHGPSYLAPELRPLVESITGEEAAAFDAEFEHMQKAEAAARDAFKAWGNAFINDTGYPGTDFESFQGGAAWARSQAPAPGESPAEHVCAQAYQVVGSLLSDLDQFETDRAEKILDNLSQARMVHDDVLPWPSFASPAVADESAEAGFEVWEGDELFAGTSGPRAQAWAELQRYAAQCEGVIRVFEVSRVERTLSYVPVQESGQ